MCYSRVHNREVDVVGEHDIDILTVLQISFEGFIDILSCVHFFPSRIYCRFIFEILPGFEVKIFVLVTYNCRFTIATRLMAVIYDGNRDVPFYLAFGDLGWDL